MHNSHYKLLVCLTMALLLFGFYCALKIGLFADTAYHHKVGGLRYFYMITLGKFPYEYANSQWYPGLYDTIVFALCKLLDNFININYVAEIRHAINYLFSSFGLLGLFFVNRKIFNKELAILSCILTLLNPIFFGHMGMNPKDPIIFTALIWTIYFFINYLENLETSRFKYLVLMSLFIGFGTGVRFTFLALMIPLFFIWLYVIFKKKINILSIILDAFCALIIIFSLAFLTWPQMHNGEFHLLLELINRSSNWLITFKHGIVNGEFYEVQNTPRTYILNIFLYRIPLYFSLLIIFSYVIVFIRIKFFIENFNSNFIIFFSLLNFLLFFPLSTMVITKTNLYDNARLFLFTMPFFATVASVGLFYIIIKLKEFNLLYKSFSFIVLVLLILSFYRFISLTPYQYVYTNYLSTPKYAMGKNKFEHDYVYTSYSELMKKIKEEFGTEETKKLKIRTCMNSIEWNKYNFRVFLNTKQTIAEDAEYIIMTNRNLKYKKMNCFQLFQGKDIVSVKRLGLTLSTLRKIESKEAREYMTHKWRLKNESWFKKRFEKHQNSNSIK